ncbi:MAG TPA: hypothetical protein VFB27_04935 [Opitutaceae bacterium]|nr:hypothetical protein [Opitutaceae bacterium]
MKFPWERLAEDLRTELGELGGLLRLVERHYAMEPQPDAPPTPEIESKLEAQAAAVQACRFKRGKMLETFTPASRFPAHLILPATMMEEVAPDARPLLQALSEEVERLDEQFHRLARGLPVATQQKLENILCAPDPALPKPHA